jgi:dipeptide/tripeptide permease
VSGLLFLGLYTVALGTGGIKPNVSAFGADQFDTRNPTHVVQKASCALRFRFLHLLPTIRAAF